MLNFIPKFSPANLLRMAEIKLQAPLSSTGILVSIEKMMFYIWDFASNISYFPVTSF